MILGILQARVLSTRFPRKVIQPILGEPMLARQIERVKRAHKMDQIVVATSLDSSDDPIQELCDQRKVDCFRGNFADVLDRFYRAAQPYSPEHIVRMTGDNPLMDPELIDDVIACHIDGKYDYTSNALEPTFPDGLDVEVFRFECLESAWKEAVLPSHREHVTPFLYQSRDRFKVGHFKREPDLSGHRWTVDEPEDFRFVSLVYETLYPSNPCFSTRDILELVSRSPELKEINADFLRNEGMQKSIREDAEFLERKKNGDL